MEEFWDLGSTHKCVGAAEVLVIGSFKLEVRNRRGGEFPERFLEPVIERKEFSEGWLGSGVGISSSSALEVSSSEYASILSNYEYAVVKARKTDDLTVQLHPVFYL